MTVPAPFSLRAAWESHGWLWAAPTRPQPERSTLQRIERIAGRPYVIEIREQRSGPGPVRLIATSDAPPRHRAGVRRAVGTMLGLDEDLTDFYTLAKQHPPLRGAFTRGVGRTVRGTTLWEDCVKGIAQTNIQWKQALVAIERICALGDRHPETARHAFPTPQQIVDAGPKWLREHARVGYRADAIVQLAHEIASGQRNLEGLARRAPAMDTQGLVAELTQIRGIGPATAHTLAGMLGKHDVVSVDSATIDYVRKHYPTAYQGTKPTQKEAASVFDHYGRWRGKAWWYEAWLAQHVNGQGTATGAASRRARN